ncbi:unnamed protein product, partial [Iphiclides podalirius]
MSQSGAMPPRQDIVVQPQRIQVEQARARPPPPPAPGRLQRPPHDHPAVYIHRPQNTRLNNNSTSTS